jgi:hypothetical protein
MMTVEILMTIVMLLLLMMQLMLYKVNMLYMWLINLYELLFAVNDCEISPLLRICYLDRG